MSDYEDVGFGLIMPNSHVTPDTVAHLTIVGEPATKERPRMSKTGHAYTPAKTRAAEKAIAELYLDQHQGLKLRGFIDLTIILYMGSKRRKDADNMAKLIQDALNGVAFDDDSQIHELHVSKRYTTPDRARAEVMIRELHSVEQERNHHVEEETN
jgi:Holliday junction resolvase RusA-like endonuclease